MELTCPVNLYFRFQHVQPLELSLNLSRLMVPVVERELVHASVNGVPQDLCCLECLWAEQGVCRRVV